MTDPRDAAVEALRELVAIVDLKKSHAQASAHAARFQTDDNYAVIDCLSTEIGQRQPLAWDAARAALDAVDAAPAVQPVAWVNGANLVSARLGRERYGMGACEQHTWREAGPTDYHDTPLYAAPAPQAAPEQERSHIRQYLIDYWEQDSDQSMAHATIFAPSDIDAVKRTIQAFTQQIGYHRAQDGLLTKAQDTAESLREQLAEVQRPLDAQMARLNQRVIELTAENDRLRGVFPSQQAVPTSQPDALRDVLQKISEKLNVMLASATPLTEGDEFVGYQIKTGALHSIIGLLVGAGVPVTVPLHEHEHEMRTKVIPEIDRKLREQAELRHEARVKRVPLFGGGNTDGR